MKDIHVCTIVTLRNENVHNHPTKHPSGTGQIASRVTHSRVFKGHQAGTNTLSFMRNLGINDVVCISTKAQVNDGKHTMLWDRDDFLPSGF